MAIVRFEVGLGGKYSHRQRDEEKRGTQLERVVPFEASVVNKSLVLLPGLRCLALSCLALP